VVELIGRPVAIIDCFSLLSDQDIRRHFELGCEAKGLGVDILKESRMK
jgi:hypothetical protein